MLINVSGRDGHYMGADLNMEHIINIQKVSRLPLALNLHYAHHSLF